VLLAFAITGGTPAASNAGNEKGAAACNGIHAAGQKGACTNEKDFSGVHGQEGRRAVEAWIELYCY
jgi:hypothetical protein